MLIEWSREVGVFCLELLSALLFFIVLLNCPFSFLYSVRLCLKLVCVVVCKTESPKTLKHVCLKTFLIFYKRLINSIIICYLMLANIYVHKHVCKILCLKTNFFAISLVYFDYLMYLCTIN